MTIPVNKTNRFLILFFSLFILLSSLQGFAYLRVINFGLGLAALIIGIILSVAGVLIFWRMGEGYLKIENSSLSVNKIYKWERIDLSKSVTFKKWAGEYILKNDE